MSGHGSRGDRQLFQVQPDFARAQRCLRGYFVPPGETQGKHKGLRRGDPDGEAACGGEPGPGLQQPNTSRSFGRTCSSSESIKPPVAPGFCCGLLPEAGNASPLLPRGPRDLHAAALSQSEPPPLSAEGKNYLTPLPNRGQSKLPARERRARPPATASGDHTAAAGRCRPGCRSAPAQRSRGV